MSRRSGARSARAARAVVALAVPLVVAVPVRANDVQGFVEVFATDSKRTTEEGGTVEQEDEIDSLRQRYNLSWYRRPSPNLRTTFTGLYESTDSTFRTLDMETDTTSTRWRPLADVSLRTRTFKFQTTFTRDEEEQKTSGFDADRTIRDVLSTTLGWTPRGQLPRVRLQYTHTDTRDDPRVGLDSVVDLAQLYTEYRPAKGLRLNYRGTLQNSEDRIEENEIRTITHNGRAAYSENFWDRRVSLSTSAAVSERELEITTQGRGEDEFPLSPFEGLFVLDDMPNDDALLPLPALIDGNRVASAGVNLGLPPPGADDRPRNLGLDLGDPTQINTLRVWLDREIDPGIADSFAWGVYTSEDNDNWVLRQTVAPALFGSFENRFDINFRDLTARYVKLVVEPLSNTVAFSQDWPEIFVTELEAILRRPAGELKTRDDSSSERYNLSLRSRLMRQRALFHELTYFLRRSSGTERSWSLSNGISYSQPLSDTVSMSTRVSHENGQSRGEDRELFRYSASLLSVPLETLRYNLIVSGTEEEFRGDTLDRQSILLNTLAELYQGVNLNLGLERAFGSQTGGQDTETDRINAVATIVPHRWLTFHLVYQDQTTRRDDTPDQVTQSEEIALTFNPLSTVYAYGSYRIEKRTNVDRRNIRDYTVTWSPFPYGALRVSVQYNEVFRSDRDERQSVFVPSLRWEITERWYIDAAFQQQTTESVARRLEDEIASATMRISF